MKGSTRSRALPHHESENNTRPADNDRVRLRGDWLVERLAASVFDRLQYSAITSSRGFAPRFPFAVNADADGVRLHVAVADDESRGCGIAFHLFGTLDFGGGYGGESYLIA